MLSLLGGLAWPPQISLIHKEYGKIYHITQRDPTKRRTQNR